MFVSMFIGSSFTTLSWMYILVQPWFYYVHRFQLYYTYLECTMVVIMYIGLSCTTFAYSWYLHLVLVEIYYRLMFYGYWAKDLHTCLPIAVLFRFQLYYTRPRMYLFTYAFDDQDTNELYSGKTSNTYVWNL